MNFVSRLLATVGLAALVSGHAASAAEPGTPNLAGVHEMVAATFSGVEIGRMTVPEFKDLVSQVVAAVIAIPGMTPELAASAVTQAVSEMMAAGITMSPSIVETVQATVAQSVVDAYGAQGVSLDTRAVAQAAATGVTTTGSIEGGRGEAGRDGDRHHDIASSGDGGNNSAY